MKDISIEYAHIYTNSQIDEEQEKSIQILDSIQYEKASLVVMVDDYSFPDPTFDYEKLFNWLEQAGHKPDLVFRESQLIPVCDQVLEIMEEGKLKKQIISYIKDNKYPCSLFVAAWYLLRLGKISNPLFPESEVSHKLLNILPESFRTFEDKAFTIIEKTPFLKSVKVIENRYFEGRTIG